MLMGTLATVSHIPAPLPLDTTPHQQSFRIHACLGAWQKASMLELHRLQMLV